MAQTPKEKCGRVPLHVPLKSRKPLYWIVKGVFCGNSWNRTNDTSIFSAVLYQLSYVAVSPLLGTCFGDRKGTRAK